MNLKLGKREKVLLVVLIVMLIAVCYYKVFLEPLNNQIASVESDTANDQTEMDTNLVTSLQMKKMEQEIEEIRSSEDYEELPAYDNSRKVMQELYTILDSTEDYMLEFGETTEDACVVSRPVELEYRTATYQAARKIIDRLADSEYVVSMGDITVQIVDNKSVENGVYYEVRLSLTYYEADLG